MSLAARLLPLIDLTSLQDNQADDIEALCTAGRTPHGNVAALCSWPRHVARLRACLGEGGPPWIASVVNFPAGAPDSEAASAEARACVADGADELDLVWPYQAWLAGEREEALALVAAVRDAAPDATLKVILETGAFGEDAAGIEEVSAGVIAVGADMLKTSTGKTATGATPIAARAMLEAIRAADRPVGFKASGGIRSLAEAAVYLELAEEIMGVDWIAPESVRIGASRLLDEVLQALDTEAGA